MSESLYAEKLVMPNDTMLTYDLMDTKRYLDQIAEFIKNEYGDFKTEWKFYNKQSGWIMKMFSKKRNVLFIIPCEKFFSSNFYSRQCSVKQNFR